MTEIIGLDDRELNELIPSEVCNRCKHLAADRRYECKAFPKGIPYAIWIGKNDHTKPYLGDNGIQFEAIDTKTPEQ